MKVWKVLLYFLWGSSNWQNCFKMADIVDNSPFVLYTNFQISSIIFQSASYLLLNSTCVMGKYISHQICQGQEETLKKYEKQWGKPENFCKTNGELSKKSAILKRFCQFEDPLESKTRLSKFHNSLILYMILMKLFWIAPLIFLFLIGLILFLGFSFHSSGYSVFAVKKQKLRNDF